MELKDYKRKITHRDYGKAEAGLQQYAHGVDKVITEKNFFTISKELLEKDKRFFANDDYIKIPTFSNYLPYIVGGVALAMIINYLIFINEGLDFIDIFFFSISCIFFIFFAVYFFTMPKKEQILNRKDGLITFTGLLWQKNITMPFKNAIFCYSTGGEDATGAFMLQVIRPTKGYTFEDFMIGAQSCYEDISLITWYMDKNRPLPPGDAFDEYMLQDFERRKAEGFPRPGYPSNIPTPEATKEQQTERENIGGW
jgi:hypothetical protein